MIFVTIGTQEPFDRLIKAMDQIAEHLPGIEIVAQVANSEYKPSNLKIVGFLSPKEFQNYFDSAELIVSHAGMGTIISALQTEKPLVVLPRLTSYGEHRNEHQLATAEKFKDLNYVEVAFDIKELQSKVLAYYKDGKFSGEPLYKLGPHASDSLIKSLKNFIHSF